MDEHMQIGYPTRNRFLADFRLSNSHLHNAVQFDRLEKNW